MNPTAVIPATYQGQRLDVALASLYPEFSRTQLTAALKDGRILINGEIHKPKEKVQGEEIITLTADTLSPALNQDILPEAIDLAIIYEDADLLVVNKPAGLVVHPGAGNPTHTLVNALLFYHPALNQLPRAGIIHRLDKDTTGLLIVAKTQVCYLKLIEQMRLRQIRRLYLALVQGHTPAPNTLTTAFGRDPKNRVKMAVRREGKEAITHYLPLQYFQRETRSGQCRFTLLQVELKTGRTHQIRVHMAHIKFPIVGDPLYGKVGHYSFPIPIKRQALHAHKLYFLHPMTQQPIELEAPLPSDFQELLDFLE